MNATRRTGKSTPSAPLRKPAASRKPATKAARAPASPRRRPAPRTQEQRTAAARQQIIDAAFACLGELGYQDMTLADVARSAGCSRELPRYHFGSREGLISALIAESERYWATRFSELSTSHESAVDALCGIVDLYAAPFTRDSPRLRGQAVLVFGAADPGNRKLREQLSLAQRRLRQLLGSVVARDPRFGPAGRDVPALATILYGTLRGLMYQWLVDGADFDGRVVVDEFKILIRSLFSAFEEQPA